MARAREARESMMRLTHSIWTAVRGDSWRFAAPGGFGGGKKGEGGVVCSVL